MNNLIAATSRVADNLIEIINEYADLDPKDQTNLIAELNGLKLASHQAYEEYKTLISRIEKLENEFCGSGKIYDELRPKQEE